MAKIRFHSRLSKHWTNKDGALRASLGVVQQTYSGWVQEDRNRLNYVMPINDVKKAVAVVTPPSCEQSVVTFPLFPAMVQVALPSIGVHLECKGRDQNLVKSQLPFSMGTCCNQALGQPEELEFVAYDCSQLHVSKELSLFHFSLPWSKLRCLALVIGNGISRLGSGTLRGNFSCKPQLLENSRDLRGSLSVKLFFTSVDTAASASAASRPMSGPWGEDGRISRMESCIARHSRHRRFRHDVNRS